MDYSSFPPYYTDEFSSYSRFRHFNQNVSTPYGDTNPYSQSASGSQLPFSSTIDRLGHFNGSLASRSSMGPLHTSSIMALTNSTASDGHGLMNYNPAPPFLPGIIQGFAYYGDGFGGHKTTSEPTLFVLLEGVPNTISTAAPWPTGHLTPPIYSNHNLPPIVANNRRKVWAGKRANGWTEFLEGGDWENATPKIGGGGAEADGPNHNRNRFAHAAVIWRSMSQAEKNLWRLRARRVNTERKAKEELGETIDDEVTKAHETYGLATRTDAATFPGVSTRQGWSCFQAEPNVAVSSQTTSNGSSHRQDDLCSDDVPQYSSVGYKTGPTRSYDEYGDDCPSWLENAQKHYGSSRPPVLACPASSGSLEDILSVDLPLRTLVDYDHPAGVRVIPLSTYSELAHALGPC